MIVAKWHANMLENIPLYTNEAYLEFQILQLQNVFCSEPSAIKNTELEFVAFSNEFAVGFGLEHNDLGKRVQDFTTISESACQEIEKQEREIITMKKSQDTIFHVKVRNQQVCYLMRKRPLVNPATQDVVGILIVAARFDLLFHRKALYKRLLGQKSSTSFVKNKPVTDEQQLIVTCLLLGFHQRKEIVSILNKITTNEIDDIQVRNQLHKLYDKYNCSSTHELVNLIGSDEKFTQSTPEMLIPDGSFPIK